MIKPKMVLNGECMRTEEVMKQRTPKETDKSRCKLRHEVIYSSLYKTWLHNNMEIHELLKATYITEHVQYACLYIQLYINTCYNSGVHVR